MKLKRRLVLSLGMVALLGAFAGPNGVDARSTAGSPEDFVLASFDVFNSPFGVIAESGPAFGVIAESGPAGENPRGRLTVQGQKGKVDCLLVHGHEALVIGDLPGKHFVITLILRDNRPGPDELVLFDGRDVRPPRQCGSWDGTHGAPGTPVSGDIWVHNAH